MLNEKKEEGDDGEEEEEEEEEVGKRRHNMTAIACGMETENIYHLLFDRKSVPTSAPEY